MSHAMSGSGDYRDHSDYQSSGAKSGIDLVTTAASGLVDPAGRELQIVDYGCAQGRVSNQLLTGAIQTIRSTNRDGPIVVCHNDVLENDWATLFESIKGPDSYLMVEGGPIRPMVSARTFYTPVVAEDSVDLGISFAALQWLAHPGPTDAGTALYFDQLADRSLEEMGRQADADWIRFLELRQRELADGGRLVLNMMHVPDGGQSAGHQVWGEVRRICEDLVDEGFISESRLDEYVFPVWERTSAEVLRPFESDEVLLHIEDFTQGPVPNPIAARFEEDGDSVGYASRLVGFFRAFSEPSLKIGLAMTEDAVCELFRRLQDWAAQNAESVRFDVHAATLLLSHRR